MRSIPRKPKRFGRKAKKWWEKSFSNQEKNLWSFLSQELRDCCSQVAQERDGRHIRVNPVAPGAGSIVTAIWKALGLAKEAVDEWTEQTAAELPLKRFGLPNGLAAIAAFLASHDASYITGVEFNVDGGLGQF